VEEEGDMLVAERLARRLARFKELGFSVMVCELSDMSSWVIVGMARFRVFKN
jgi:hypothetical protein